MQRSCEVCAAGAHEAAAGPEKAQAKLRRILIGERIVALCATHASVALERGAATLTALRGMFPEATGQRSLVQRRSPLDRRVFPARPEGRRRSMGRRSSDEE